MTGAAMGFLIVTWTIVFTVMGISLKALIGDENKKK